MNRILAIDSSTEACSVALLIGEQVYSRFELAPRRHAELLLPMVDAVLKEAKVILSDLDAIGCCVGPGAFTGLRIAISVAQGLAYGVGIPCIAVSSLAAMATESFSINKSLCCLVSIDARMSEVYFGSFIRDEGDLAFASTDQIVVSPLKLSLSDKITKPFLPNQINNEICTIAGTGWSVYDFHSSMRPLKEYQCEILYPKAEFVVQLALRDFRLNKLCSASELRPSYLRNNVAKKKSEQK
ncbi:MAG: tRNA (adenosine(37)-N6)-threonylcarbamoyltransferase complex dimerization subunit type 1 TsaB [Kangiellaceae bacterium]|nr:tRNA (adenosine(37)-N6)-threonylcarbamoyltransferase complex dimerization subunit type 1 TsaB [Kangiellaceae bacterium]